MYRDQQQNQQQHYDKTSSSSTYGSTIDRQYLFPIQNLLQKLVDLEWTVLEGHEHQGEDEEYLDSSEK